MGKDKSKRTTEVAALRTGIELGMTLVDTAEMYANGAPRRSSAKRSIDILRAAY